ncbi:dTDP-4-dehydrorhamnose 3,5-epimerase family protein [Pedobacter sp. MC2016-14]|uniref:dTDP-4-dehydrorhamnose 3,5-epimerase family protein n=1 Tax=Pedobacter sp. MC2016-14 TaxID=2897327 RepID=UPI001E62F33C|nr:dTDP-4-dehydrorhamnose 3,5-epimerase family protein [Pedobacter sp. MC2016-14]MCD0486944.1 dTDP-4-dehydrorhamnose 3,5-epimerase family protein [Pedobacter sp. MC2016-14]
MGEELIAGVFFYPLSPIETTGGKVMHAVKGLDIDLPAFGECYFSTAVFHDPKAWKKHTQMVCNLFVPKGAVRFVFYDDREGSADYGKIQEFELSENAYGRLVIHPGIWFGFASLAGDGDSIVMNVASMPHSREESMRLEPGSNTIPYQWKF